MGRACAPTLKLSHVPAFKATFAFGLKRTVHFRLNRRKLICCIKYSDSRGKRNGFLVFRGFGGAALWNWRDGLNFASRPWGKSSGASLLISFAGFDFSFRYWLPGLEPMLRPDPGAS